MLCLCSNETCDKRNDCIRAIRYDNIQSSEDTKYKMISVSNFDSCLDKNYYYYIDK